MNLFAKRQVALLEFELSSLIKVKAHMIPRESFVLHSYSVEDRVVWELLDGANAHNSINTLLGRGAKCNKHLELNIVVCVKLGNSIKIMLRVVSLHKTHGHVHPHALILVVVGPVESIIKCDDVVRIDLSFIYVSVKE